MKDILKTFLLFWLPMIALSSSGQFLNEPKYVGNVYFIEGDEPPIKLERQLTRYTRKVMIFKEATSTVAIDSTGVIKMIVKVIDNQIDPINVVRVYRIHSSEKKNYRYMPLRNDNPMKIKFINYDKLERIFMNTDPFGKSSYLLYLQNLRPGEYVITVNNDKYGWNLFSVK